jgi:YfiH family protein
MVTFHGTPPTHLSLQRLDILGVRHAFSTRRHGSIPAVSAPGGPFPDPPGPALTALGVAGDVVRFARQVHGTACLVADDGPPGLLGVGDAIATARAGVPLAVFTADCLPVILAEPDQRVLAVAHAGWRGTVAGILPRLLETLAGRFGARSARLHAAVGPSIGPCCYEVDEAVVGPLQAAFPADAARWVRARRAGKWMLDLWRASADQLVAAGVPADAIVNPQLCTACRRDLFFSYRKEGMVGRLAALAVLGSP